MFPKIGPRPIAEIDSPQMLSIVREVEARGVRNPNRDGKIDSSVVRDCRSLHFSMSASR